ncbi:MAG TPA: hypothetical protein VH374_08030 [Polyangia bacterium]|nr:hypothetical protein [Polyangia bacterium]
MAATTEEDKQFSDSMLRWMDEGDRLHEDPRHAHFAGEPAAPRPWKLWLGVVWAAVMLVVGGRFVVQRLSANADPGPAAMAAAVASVIAAPGPVSPAPAVVAAPAPTAESRALAAMPTGNTVPKSDPPAPVAFAPASASTETAPVAAVAKEEKVAAAPVVAPPMVAAEKPAPARALAPAPVAAPAALETAPPVTEDFDSLLGKCRDGVTRGHWGAARAACAAAQQLRPDSPEVLTRMAEIALNRGQERVALRLASAALAADPGFADAYVIVGSVEQGANRNEQARAAYTHYLKLAPSGRYASDLRAVLPTL